MFVDKKVLEFMLMLLLIIWREMVMIISQNIAQDRPIGALKTQVEDLLIGVKDTPMKTGLLQVVDQECKCLQFLMALMIFIVRDH